VFELDLLQGELRKAGLRLNLPDQPFQLLAALLERSGQIVTRDELRQRLWRGETFVDFDQGLNAAVKRLRDVLGDSAETPRFIQTVPRRGYRFLGIVDSISSGSDTEPRVPAKPDRPRSWNWLPWVGAGTLAAIALIWATQRSPVPVSAGNTVRVVPVTSMRGYEGGPSFSPDGTAIAFSHAENGAQQNWGIYVVRIGDPEPRRLSPDHRGDGMADVAPSWSPDGQRIAFVRRSDDAQHVYVMSVFGSAITKVSDLTAGTRISWSPDSEYVVASRQASADQPDAGLYVIPVRGGSPRALTHTRFPVSDVSPVLSDDGSQLAYAECRGPDDDDCEILVLGLTAQLAPVGPARRVSKAAGVNRLSWGPDGHSLIFGTLLAFLPTIWRVDTDGQHVAARIEVAGQGAWTPTVSSKRERLAFAAGRLNPTVYQFDAKHGARPLLESSFSDTDARWSADGRFVALSSTRSGNSAEIWIADDNGQNAHQVTHGPGLWQGSPQWCPDGKALVFDSLGTDMRWHVWAIDAAGGAPRQLTHGHAENLPTCSSDGKWIYYTAYVDGQHTALWKTSVDGGSPERVDRADAGGRAQELAGGRALVYQPAHSDGPLMTAPVGHGPSRQIAACARAGAFVVKPFGIYYVACGPTAVAHRADLDGSHDRVVGKLEGFSGTAIDISADGRTIIYDHLEPSMEFDIYLIENFR
jgi:Tol biopolymer transport system component/DNA-binding winged helix-turn-helix (wHTH) protein